MSESHEQDPAPLEHVDAERVSSHNTGEQPDPAPESPAEELESDPSRDPGDERQRDVEGGQPGG